MDFPITELMDREACLEWILAYFHPGGLICPHCGAGQEQARWFRRTKRSDLDVYRCKACQGIYNLYSGTVFEGRHFHPEQTVLFLRGICQNKSSAQLARELGISRTTIIEVRHEVQTNAEQEQPEDPLDDLDAKGGNRRIVPECGGIKGCGMVIQMILPGEERTSDGEGARMIMIDHLFVQSLVASLAKSVSEL